MLLFFNQQGPQTWSRNFTGARGTHQSPINIETKTAVYNYKLMLENPLEIQYDEKSCFQIKNTGHTFQGFIQIHYINFNV